MNTTERMGQEIGTMKSIGIKDIIKRSAHHTDRHIHNGCLTGYFQNDTNSFFEDPIRLDAFAFILCLKGSFVFTCNLKEYKLEEGSLMMLPPKSLITEHVTKTQHDGYAVIFDQKYMSDCNFNMGRITSLMMQLNGQLSTKITTEEQNRLLQAIQLLNTLIDEQSKSSLRDEVMRSMVETLIYQFLEIFSLHTNDESNNAITRQEAYFRRFMQELSEHYIERQGVNFYAEKLCISSRYLTTIVRRISGLTVTEWMNRYLIMEAKYLLKYSESSIQEIAYRLSFPDQSFFGKYFKQHVGMSPSAYRSKGK